MVSEFRRIIWLSLVLVGFLINAAGQNHYPNFPKIGNEYDSAVVNGVSVIRGDLLKTPGFIYLNDSKEFIQNYRSRYDYNQTKSASDITYHLSTVYENDTSSISFRNSYLDIFPSYLSDNYVPITYVKEEPVTVKEWNNFQRYIRDSIMIRYLSEEDEGYLVPTYRISKYGKEETDYSEWILNWDAYIKVLKKYSKKKENYMLGYFRYIMTLPESERWNQKEDLDSRKLAYIYREIQIEDALKENLDKLKYRPVQDQIASSHVYGYQDPFAEKDLYVMQYSSAFIDSSLWKLQSLFKYRGDIGDQISKNYFNSAQFENAPIAGLTSLQAKAYLHWLQKEHQKELDKSGSPFYVEYTLPTPVELGDIDYRNYTIDLESIDLSPWRITNKEYKSFVDYCLDSMLLEEYKYYTNDPYENYIPTYGPEMDERDISEWHLRLNTVDKLLANDTTGFYEGFCYWDQVKNKEVKYDWDYHKVSYRYYDMNFDLASQDGQMVVGESYYSGSPYECDKGVLELLFKKYNAHEPGKDLLLTNSNRKCQNADVRSVSDRSRFIESNIVSVYPGYDCFSNSYCDGPDYSYNYDSCCIGMIDYETTRIPEYDFITNPDESVKINYRQAYAYYVWKTKQEGFIVKTDEKLFENYVPSEDEWIKIQARENVTHSAEKYFLPTPTFTYTLKFYPKPKNIRPLNSPLTIYSNMTGSSYDAPSKDRKAYFKEINSVLKYVYEYHGEQYQIIQNKTTGKFGVTNSGGRVLVDQVFDGVNIDTNKSENYLEVYNGLKKSCVSMHDYPVSVPSNYFNELDYSRTNEDVVLVKTNGLWGAYYPSLDFMLLPCIYSSKDEVPKAKTYGLSYLTSYIEDLKRIGFTTFKPDDNGDGCFYAMNSDNKWGFYQMSQEKIPPIYDSIMEVGYNRPFTLVYKNGKVGVFKGFFSTPSESVPCIYDEGKRIKANNGYYFAAKNDGNWGYVNWNTGEYLTDFIYKTFEDLPRPDESW